MQLSQSRGKNSFLAPLRKSMFFVLVVSIMLSAQFSGVCLAGSWSPVGSMTTARIAFRPTLLANGKLLVAGGNDKGIGLSAEIFDPTTNIWNPAGNMINSRDYGHTATLLTNGKVLVAGGSSSNGLISTVELYDPDANSWSSLPLVAILRNNHSATLLPNGKVLVVGGSDIGGALASALLYDPTDGSWSPAAPLTKARSGQMATLLDNGKVLVIGGYNGSFVTSAEMYDPATDSWSPAGSMLASVNGYTATLLNNGKVLLIVGGNVSGYGLDVETFDPATNNWTYGSTLGGTLDGNQNFGYSATLLPNGTVIVAGGSNIDEPLSTVALYDPAADSWSRIDSLATARRYHSATLLSDGTVLVTGGDHFGALSSAELYTPPIVPPTTTAKPQGGSYTATQRVTLTTNETATIYYTTDGSSPTTSSTVYTGPITIVATTTLNYFAVGVNGQENMKSASYHIIPTGGGVAGYTPPLRVNLPYKPWGIASSDFNQDGKADLAVANYYQNTVTAYSGNGDGTLTSVQEIGVDSQPTSVTFGTLNGYDMNLDMVTANSGTGSLSMFLGTGSNYFSFGGAYSSGAGSTSALIGHFRNTGPPDLAVTNYNTGYLNIYYGQGSGVFYPGFSYYVGAGVVSVAKGDFNNDYKEDLVVVNYDSGQVTILAGTGTGTFNSFMMNNYSTPQYARSVTAGDTNGDGHSDLVVVSDGGETIDGTSIVTILLGNGTGYFQKSAQFQQSQFTCGAAIADFNSDGKVDLALINRSTGTLSILFQGFGFGTTVQVNPANPTNYATVQAALASAMDGDVLTTLAGDIYENLTLDRDIQIIIKGGSSGISGGVTSFTILHGTLTISSGSLVAENLIII